MNWWQSLEAMFFPRRLFRRSQKSTWELIDEISNVRRSLAESASAEQSAILNVCQFACLFFYDFSVLIEEVCIGPTSKRHGVFARVVALHCVEGFEDFGEILGGQFESNMKTVGAGEKDIERLEAVRLKLRGVRKRYESQLRVFRNEVMAHRAHDAQRQLELMASISVKEVLPLARAVTAWHTDLLGVLKPLVSYLGGKAAEIEAGKGLSEIGGRQSGRDKVSS